MVSFKYFLLGFILSIGQIVYSQDVPPFCSIRFHLQNLGNRFSVRSLGLYQYHVQPKKSPVSTADSVFDRTFSYQNRGFDPNFPTVVIECTSSYIADFEFQGVEAIQYISIQKSRKFVPADSPSNLVQNITITAALTANATGEYVIYSKENPNLRTAYYIFAQTEAPPNLLGRGRRLAGLINNNNILIPCVSSNPDATINLYHLSYQENSYVQVVDPGVQYDRKIGFIIPRKRFTANKLLGEYRCADSQALEDEYVTIDVKEQKQDQEVHPMLHINLFRNGGAECVAPQGSPVQLIKLLANPYEAATLVNCFDGRNKVCGDIKEQVHGVQESWRSVSTISNFTDNSGLLICYSDKDIVSAPFLKALDGIYYKRVNEIPIDHLLRITVVSAGSSSKRQGRQVTLGSHSAEGAFVYAPRIYYAKFRNGTVARVGEISYYDTSKEVKVLLNSEVTEVIVDDVLVQTGKTVTVSKPLQISRLQCDENEFRCASEECIGADERCDHVVDCNDGISDEENCTNYTRACLSTEYTCKSGQCIPEFKVCNERFDCLDRSDEESCTGSCAEDYFRCRNGECIRKSYVCDNDKDCSDGSDEIWNICANCNNDPNKFKCRTGGCINRERVCDGEPTCDDKSDELYSSCEPYVPRIVNTRSNYAFTSGDDHYLVCEVRIPSYAQNIARFVPKVIWTTPSQNFNQDRVQKMKRTGVTYSSTRDAIFNSSSSQETEYAFFYRLAIFDDSDVGTYVCEAKNDAGSTRRSFKVTLEDCDYEPEPSPPPRPVQPAKPATSPPRPGHPARPPPVEYPEPSEPGNGQGGDEGGDFECSKAGKFSDPEQCTVYHECVADGTKLNHYRFSCGPGTVYCGQSQYCGWEKDCPCYVEKFKNKFQKIVKRRF